MKRNKLTSGTILKVPLKNNSFTYARVLNFYDIGIYDFKLKQDLGLEDILSGKILFSVKVDFNDLIFVGWPIVGFAQLEEELQHSKYWLPEIGHPDKCKLMVDDIIHYNIPASEANNLEYGIRWSPYDIIDRINDHHDGKPNKRLVVPGHIETGHKPLEEPTIEQKALAKEIKAKANFLYENEVKSQDIRSTIELPLEEFRGDLLSLQKSAAELDKVLKKNKLKELFDALPMDKWSFNCIVDEEKDEVVPQEIKIKFLSIVSDFIEKPLSLDPILSSMTPIIRTSIQNGQKEEIDSLYDDMREMLGDMPSDIKRKLNKELKAGGINAIK